MLVNYVILNLRWVVRDKVLQALLGVALFLLCLVPVISSLSMRQVQELSLTLTLSAISFVLFVFATILGASSIWRDIEKRYVPSTLTFPTGRGTFLVGKFLAIAVSLVASAAVLGAAGAIAVVISAAQYPSSTPIQWAHYFLAIGTDTLKYVLLVAVAMLFSTISTSFFLPFFGTVSIFLAGSASQEVYEFVMGEFGKKVAAVPLLLIKGVYYLLPNLGVFDHKLQAIYPVPLSSGGLLYLLAYFLIYTGLVLSLAVAVFSRRELP